MSILKLKDSQGNWISVPTLKGDKGNGIQSAVLNDDYTLTLTFTDGTTYTTPSIRGEKGEKGEPATDMEIHICSITEYDAETRIPTIANPNDKTFYLVPTEDGTSPDLFTEWVYVNGAWEMFGSMKIDLSGYLTDVQINGTSIVENGVANVPVASRTAMGVAKFDTGNGIDVVDNVWRIVSALSTQIKGGAEKFRPVTPNRQHESTFYGLAKAAGDTTQSQSSNTVGNYTDNAKDKIQTMLGISPLIAPHESDPFESNHVIGELFIINGKLYRAKTALTAGEYVNEGTNVEVVDIAEVLDSKVRDVQINGNSVAENGVANIPIGTLNNFGVLKVGSGLGVNQGLVTSNPAVSSDIKAATANYKQIVPSKQHESVFYGLAKASGDTTQSASSNAVGTYTDEAKASIKSMLGVQDGMVVNATLVSGTQYTIDSTYDDIKTALSVGKTVVVMTQGVPQPFVGNVQVDSIWYLAFGVSTIFNRRAVLTGFLIPEAYQNIAIWMEEFAVIPDVQIDGASIVTNGVANIPIASANRVGVVKTNAEKGIGISGNQELSINCSNDTQVKNGTEKYRPLVPSKQHVSTFYGLAKAAGYDEKNSTLSIGEYTEDAKSAISEMLGGSVSVSGTTPTIVAKSGIRYVCGEVLSLKFTPSTNGICDVMFTSGSTPTVLTLPNTVKMPEWFIIEANMTYEINIADGIYGAVTSWTL